MIGNLFGREEWLVLSYLRKGDNFSPIMANRHGSIVTLKGK